MLKIDPVLHRKFWNAEGVQAIYAQGLNFIKDCVMLLDLQSSSIEQKELDLEDEPASRGQLMMAMDKLNDWFGRGTVIVASAGLKGKKRSGAMRQELLTPQYTTRWDELPVAVA